MRTGKVKEIFTSIQGEGPYIGYKQLFIRFCGCNLNCEYCDTNFDKEDSQEYSAAELASIISQNSDCHSVSLTGGEPLLHWEFLREFIPNSALPVYLETNGSMPENLAKVIDYISYVSADIKLPSCTGLEPQWAKHDEFFRVASTKELFAKIVFDQNITDEEIQESVNLGSKYNIELILQPRMLGDKPAVSSDFMTKILDKFTKLYPKSRLIPQVHKFIDVI